MTAGLLPSILAHQVRHGIEEFLLTTFPVTNPFFAGIMERLLGRTPGPDGTALNNYIFRGPYLSLKLPFQLAPPEGRHFFDPLIADFIPYVHQYRAWQRLDSRSGQSTVVATGTNSGKTESFLYPILDYCRRNAGRKGIKAILIYPMNALATDQAQRLAKVIYKNPVLKSFVTAGLYVGDEEKEPSTAMREDSIVTHKQTLRLNPPDILVTNYKMLDYLLLRPEDYGLWAQNQPDTLRYLVVDELHTFDGAQGADLACLIRRVKQRLKTPKGSLVCVGTSATLGEGSPADLTTYAEQIFGETFSADSVIGETVLSADEFLAGSTTITSRKPFAAQQGRMDPLTHASVEDYLAAQRWLWFGEAQGELAALLKNHAVLQRLIRAVERAPRDWSELIADLSSEFPDLEVRGVEMALASLLSLVSSTRTPENRPLVEVRLQLWLRELRRMVGSVGTQPQLAFADDLKPDQVKRSLPVIQCRECGLTGWAGVVRDADHRIQPDLQTFYNAFFDNAPQTVFVYPGMDQPAGQQDMPTYLCPDCLSLQAMNEERECGHCGTAFVRLIRAWVPESNFTVRFAGGHEKRLSSHDCPRCQGSNSLAIVGSRAASLTSVLIAQLFGSPFNGDKKLLAFSDSVQDASHRAGFFAARTYGFNLRSAIQKMVMESTDPVALPELPARFREFWHGRLSNEEYLATFFPPDLDWTEDWEHFRESGKLPSGSNLLQLVEKRLHWEIWSEYTFDCRIGRTLEKTGSSTIEIVPEVIERFVALLPALREKIGPLRDIAELEFQRFVLGFAQNLKNRGGVLDPLVDKYVEEGGNTWRLGKRFEIWRPNFSRFQRAPVFLANRPLERFLTLKKPPSQSSPTWHEDWVWRCFETTEAEPIYEVLLPGLREAGLVEERMAQASRVWGLGPAGFQTATQVVQLRCDICQYALSLSAREASVMDGAHCLNFRCHGKFSIHPQADDYYRRLYESGTVQRIFAAEHTGLLARQTREEIEDRFKKPRIPGDPNLLSCTPTLEMGIDIGDLSSLALCSVPPKPSNYLQRAGRAGRSGSKPGNAFVFTVANARPHDLFFYFEPQEMIRGLVETPGCFLNASAVLARQFTAYVLDRWVETGIPPEALPRQMKTVLDSIDAGDSRDFPAPLMRFFDANRTALEDGFLAMFQGNMEPETAQKLRSFSRGTDPEVRGLKQSIDGGLEELAKERKSLRSRVQSLTKKINELEKSPAKSQDHDQIINELKTEKAALNGIIQSINGKHVLNFLTDEGLLPNYAFPEAGVQLRSVIYRRNPNASDEGKKYQTKEFQYERPASSAIAELAPANNFYVEGRRLTIDEVNLRLSKLEIWRFCNNCSYVALDSPGNPQASCPKCGSVMWSDDGQKRPMLRMRQVVSTQSEQESRSHDESDDREPVFFQKNMFVVYDDDHVTEAYAIDKDDVPFGFEFLRKVRLIEVNFGEKSTQGGQFHAAGKTLIDRPFRLCRACGKVEKKGTIKHSWTCPYAGADEKKQKDTLEACFLYREFSSEAIRILLPVAVFNLALNIESFVAALDLGLRKHFRGDPGHLMTTLMDEPVRDGGVRKQYLVLYDGVPGGTGYLKELMKDPQTLITVFEKAYAVMESCGCQNDPDKDGCYRCLLAYRGRHEPGRVSRAAALELFKLILDNRELLKQTDRLAKIQLKNKLESELEEQFAEALRRTPGIKLEPQVVQGKNGFYLRSTHGNWLIATQVELGPAEGVAVTSRADFVLYPDKPLPGELPVVVFTDGYEYHADPNGGMRLDVDTDQRMAILRSRRYRVWSLNWDDVIDQLKNPIPAYDPWFTPGPASRKWIRLSSFQGLLALLGERRGCNWQEAGLETCGSLSKPISSDGGVEFKKAASGLSVCAHLEATAFAAKDLSNLQVLMRLDEAQSGDKENWKRAWRESLRLANFFQFVDGFEWRTSRGEAGGKYQWLAGEEIPLLAQHAGTWGTDLSLVARELRSLCSELATLDVPEPEFGFELPAVSGEIVATAELAWPESRVALLLDAEMDGKKFFVDSGWKVFEPGTQAAALKAALESDKR